MIYLNSLGIICPLGNTHAEIKQNMLVNPSSRIVISNDWKPFNLPLGISQVRDNVDFLSLPIEKRSRNNIFVLAAIKQIRPAIETAIGKYGKDRVGVIVGTTTSGIAESEKAFQCSAVDGKFPSDFHYAQQELGSLSEVIADSLGITGPSYVHSSACSSGAKAIASAARLIEAGICDAVVTGGVDTLSSFVIAGFSSLDAVSTEQTNPFSRNRKGINLGEGAAIFLMSKEPVGIALSGWGEASDGHHISAPDPEGKGAKAAISQALSKAGIDAGKIDYINLHGTGTQQNDSMESRVVNEMFGTDILCSSTKAMTGHTLGAAGAVEAALCWIAMQENPDGIIPPHLFDGEYDPELPEIHLAKTGSRLNRPIQYCLSTSFAFGGSNAALILGSAHETA